MRALAIIEAIGNALVLQVVFLVVSLPIVTAAPAAFALQRSLAASAAGDATGFRSFVREFREQWRARWPLGIVVAAVGIGFLVGIPFWYSVGDAVGIIALGTLVAILGLAIGMWLSLLAVVVEDRSGRWRPLVNRGFAMLTSQPLRALAGVVLVLVWVSVAWFVPTLLLVGSGLIPALITRFTLQTGHRG